VAALGEMPDLSKAVWPTLLAAASDADGQVRQRAVQILKDVSEREIEISAGLSERLLTPSLPAAQVVQTVEQYGLRAPRAVAALVGAAQAGPTRVRDDALKQLRRIGPAAREATPYLLSALEDNNGTTRCHCCQALAAIKPDGAQVVPALTETLDDPDTLVRASAANALGAYGAKASVAVRRLAELYKMKEGVEKYCLGRALTQIDPAVAVKLDME
jgi:HEAT repeat protein